MSIINSSLKKKIMKLMHVALWTNNLERSRDFYTNYFKGESNEKYLNEKKGFSSYFITFEGGMSLEIMQRTDIRTGHNGEFLGLAHFAFQTACRDEVNNLIEIFRKDGYTIFSEPRYTGDGYYEGGVLDPDGNRIELVSFPDLEISRALFYPYDLLLMADPEIEKVDAYLPVSDCFVAITREQTVGVIVVQKQSDTTAEIMNVAVSDFFQRRGIARQLVRYIIEKWAPDNHISRLVIRTGTSAPGPFMLYQQEGFNLTGVEYDYFPCHYKEPIYENGVHCRHQLIMTKEVK